MPYTWDRSALRYRYPNGRLVPERTVENRAQRYVEDAGREMRGLTDRLINESLSLPEFEAEMRRLMKDVHINMLRLGAGGRAAATSQHYGKAGAILREQYRFLRGFVDDLRAGRYASAPGQARARAQMYGKAAYQSYWAARQYAAQAAGYLWKRRVLHPGESCEDCVAQSQLGLVPIDDPRVTGVRDGSTRCLTNCNCEIVFERTLPSA